MAKKRITRREALKSMALGAAGSILMSALPWKAFGKQHAENSKVILIRHKNLTNENREINKQILTQMVDQAMLELTGNSSVKETWENLFSPDDVVGIKSNVWSHLPTPPELEQLLKKRLMNAGVDEKNIGIDDRGIYNNPIFQKGTALINVRPMRTHDWSGVGSLIKNYIMFTNRPYKYHPDTCADLAKIWKKPEVKGKTRLNILVMITPLFHGVGPHHFNKKYTWRYNGLLVGFDPVAVDATGLRIIQAHRKEYFGEERPISPSPKHIRLADTRHNLGNASQRKIDLVKLGWKEGVLI
jgi:hypothetical protein